MSLLYLEFYWCKYVKEKGHVTEYNHPYTRLLVVDVGGVLFGCLLGCSRNLSKDLLFKIFVFDNYS